MEGESLFSIKQPWNITRWLLLKSIKGSRWGILWDTMVIFKISFKITLNIFFRKGRCNKAINLRAVKAGWGIALAGRHRDLQGSWGPAQLHRSPPEELNAIPTLQKGPNNQRHRVLVRGLPGCSFISSVCTSRKNMNLLTRVHRMTTNMDSIFLFFENEPYAVRFKVSLHVVGSSEVTREPSELLWNGKILAAFLSFCSVFYLFIFLTQQTVIFGSWS